MKKNLLFSKLLFILVAGTIFTGELNAMHHSRSNIETEIDKKSQSSPQTPVLKKTQAQLLTELRQERINMMNQENENITKRNKHTINEIINKELWEDLINLLLHENNKIAQLSARNLSVILKVFASKKKFKSIINILNAINPYKRNSKINVNILQEIIAQAIILALNKYETLYEDHSIQTVTILFETTVTTLLPYREETFFLFKTLAQIFPLIADDKTATIKLLKIIKTEQKKDSSPTNDRNLFCLITYVIRTATENIKTSLLTCLLKNIAQCFPDEFNHILTKAIDETIDKKNLKALFLAMKDLDSTLTTEAIANAIEMEKKSNSPNSIKDEKIALIKKFEKQISE
ncbi:MAG: hypothetical protein ABH827_01440 [bacterium]